MGSGDRMQTIWAEVSTYGHVAPLVWEETKVGKECRGLGDVSV